MQIARPLGMSITTGPGRPEVAIRKGFMDCAGKIINFGHQIIVLCATPRDADRVALLKGIGANQMRWHLPRDHDHGDGIHHRIRNWGDHICSTRAQMSPNRRLACQLIEHSLQRHDLRTLLVANKDVANVIVTVERIVDRQHRPARIAEHSIDPLLFQRANDNIRTGQGFGCLSSCFAAVVIF